MFWWPLPITIWICFLNLTWGLYIYIFLNLSAIFYSIIRLYGLQVEIKQLKLCMEKGKKSYPNHKASEHLRFTCVVVWPCGTLTRKSHLPWICMCTLSAPILCPNHAEGSNVTWKSHVRHYLSFVLLFSYIFLRIMSYK